MTHEVAANQAVLIPDIRQQKLASVRNRTACEHIGVSPNGKFRCFLRGRLIVHAGHTQPAHDAAVVIDIEQAGVQYHIDRPLPDHYSIESPGGEIPIVAANKLVHLGIETGEIWNLSMQYLRPVFGAEIVAMEVAEPGRLRIVGVEIPTVDGPTGKARPLLEGDRIQRPALAAPVSGRATVDTLTFPGAWWLVIVRPNQEVALVGCEQAVGHSFVEQNLVWPTGLQSFGTVIAASLDQCDFYSRFLQMPRRGNAGGSGSNNAYLGRNHGSVVDIFSVSDHGIPRIVVARGRR
jgi:hypothetical protein